MTIESIPAPPAPPLVPSRELSPADVLRMLGDEGAGQLKQAFNVTGNTIQQSLNCCGFTALAYAFTAMGHTTTVDDLFHTVRASVESAVGDGMTLSEIYDAAQRFVARKNLPLRLECSHFDSFAVAEKDFRNAAAIDAAAGMDDLFVLNFHSGIANGWASGGGGHFSILAGLDTDTDSVVVADVHGMKYGAFWAAPVSQVFRAMADKDSCGRARGAIRFVRAGAEVAANPLARSLVDWNSPPAPFRAEQTSKYVPRAWDALLGTQNMEGASAVAAAMRVVEGDGHRATTLDGAMHALHESYTWHLDNFLTGDKVCSMLQALQGQGGSSGASVSRVALDKDISGAGLQAALAKAGCGDAGTVVLAAFNLNTALGAELVPPEADDEASVLAHGPRTWALLAGFDAAADAAAPAGVLVAAAHNVILAGRVWACSLDGLAAGMRAIGDVTPPALVTMCK